MGSASLASVPPCRTLSTRYLTSFLGGRVGVISGAGLKWLQPLEPKRQRVRGHHVQLLLRMLRYALITISLFGPTLRPPPQPRENNKQKRTHRNVRAFFRSLGKRLLLLAAYKTARALRTWHGLSLAGQRPPLPLPYHLEPLTPSPPQEANFAARCHTLREIHPQGIPSCNACASPPGCPGFSRRLCPT
jgi:hypothetical protein